MCAREQTWSIHVGRKFVSNEMTGLRLKYFERSSIMRLTSPGFQPGGEIPSYYTSDGEDASPELFWRDAPLRTQSFVLIVHDPDAPKPGGFTHWVVYNIPPETNHIAENVPDTERVSGLGVHGKNDDGTIGYIGPTPHRERIATSFAYTRSTINQKECGSSEASARPVPSPES
jgi:Raf kinase inhibitor-like YbhB/YbcL family protein